MQCSPHTSTPPLCDDLGNMTVPETSQDLRKSAQSVTYGACSSPSDSLQCFPNTNPTNGASDSENAPVEKIPNEASIKCNLCFQVFDSEPQLNEHVSKGHKFMCLFCDYSEWGVDKTKFELHYKTRHTNPTVLKKTRDEVVIKNLHYLSVQTKVTCGDCHRKFKTEQVLSQHKCKPKVVKLAPQMKCPLCEELYSNKNTFKIHMRQTHVLFPCSSLQNCFQYFDSLQLAKNHYKQVHKDKRRFLCETCGRMFSKPGVLREHVYYVHSNNKESLYKCTLCDKTYRYKPKLLKHMKVHKGEKTFRCRVCEEKFLKDHILHAHIVKTHKEVLFYCECGRAFATKGLLSQHISSKHVDTFTYHCSICGETSSCKQAITQHYDKHSSKEKSKSKNRGKFSTTSKSQCSICLLYVKNDRALKVHVKHSHKVNTKNTKPRLNTDLRCTQCSKLCLSYAGYVNHIAVHNKTKKISCKVCNKKFATVSQMKAHTRISHLVKDIEYVCDLCGDKFTNKKILLRHFLYQHDCQVRNRVVCVQNLGI